ncbi:MAG: NADH-quinone oxidoreductase subunit J family protein [Acidimicrobiales bacterium]
MGNLVLAASVPDALTFAIAGAICICGSLGVVFSKNPVHSALMLVMTLFGVAVLFVEQDAQFLAAVQVIVYAGAIVVLFLFVIMLLGVDQQEAIASDPLRNQRPAAVIVGILVLAEVILLARGHWPVGAHSTSGAVNTPVTSNSTTNTFVLGKAIFTTFLLPFEVTSALLIIAVIGAVVLARRPRGETPSVKPYGPADEAEDEDDDPDSGGTSGEPDLVLGPGDTDPMISRGGSR